MAGGTETSSIAALPAIALLGQPSRILPLANIIVPYGERSNFSSEGLLLLDFSLGNMG